MKKQHPLKEADAHDKKARQLYFAYIVDRILECGSVAKLAARCDMPASSIHSTIDRKGMKTLRQTAHAIYSRGDWRE